MKKGKVIVLALSHKNMNHIFKAGDEVTEKDVNNFDKLVSDGKIEEAEKEEVSELMKLTKADLIAKCKDLELDFNESDNKSELVDLIEEAEKEE